VFLTCGSGFRSTIPDDQKAWAPGARSRLPSRFTPCITTVPWLELGNETLTPVIFTAWLSLFFSSKRNTSFASEVLPDVVGARGRYTTLPPSVGSRAMLRLGLLMSASSIPARASPHDSRSDPSRHGSPTLYMQLGDSELKRSLTLSFIELVSFWSSPTPTITAVDPSPSHAPAFGSRTHTTYTNTFGVWPRAHSVDLSTPVNPALPRASAARSTH